MFTERLNIREWRNAIPAESILHSIRRVQIPILHDPEEDVSDTDEDESEWTEVKAVTPPPKSDSDFLTVDIDEEIRFVETKARPKNIVIDANLQWNILSTCIDAFTTALPGGTSFEEFNIHSRVVIIRQQLGWIKLWESFLVQFELSDPGFDMLLRAMHDLFAALDEFVDTDAVPVSRWTDEEDFKLDTSRFSRLRTFAGKRAEQVQELIRNGDFRHEGKLEEMTQALKRFCDIAKIPFDAQPIERTYNCTDFELAMARSALDFSQGSTPFFELLGSMIKEKCGTFEHNAAFTITDDSPDLLLQFPLCNSPTVCWHPVVCSRITQAQRTDLPVPDLCSQVEKMNKRRQTLHLRYTAQGIWEGKPAQPDFEIIDTKQLQFHVEDVLQSHGHLRLSPGDRELLVVQLARVLFNLLGSAWIPSFPGLDNLILFEDKDGRLSTSAPYIPRALVSQEGSTGIKLDDVVLSFGLRMLEIHASQPVPGHLLVDLESGNDQDRVPLPSCLVIRRFCQYLKHGCWVEQRYLEIANNCLDFVESAQRLQISNDLQELRSHVAFYKFIFEPLLSHMRTKFPDEATKLLPMLAPTKRNYTGRAAGPGQKTTTPSINITPPTTMSAPQSFGFQLPRAPTLGPSGVPFKSPLPLIPEVSPATKKSTKPSRSSPLVQGASRLKQSPGHFHSEEEEEGSQEARSAKTFFRLFDEFREIYKDRLGSKTRVKIAILDTGLDADQDLFEARRQMIIENRADHSDPIRVVRSFVSEPGVDVDGHGSLVAELVLRVAPDAELYIAKVCHERRLENPKVISEAIQWARERGCNIINMSFGLNPGDMTEELQTLIGRQIDLAFKANVIMFAAASNCGGNVPPTYPATDPRVICVHATDGIGNPAKFNPTFGSRETSIGTLGMGMRFEWDDDAKLKSGTSFSTPIAAGIAANVLDMARMSHDKKLIREPTWQLLQQHSGMQVMLGKVLGEVRGEMIYVAPWHLWDLNLSERVKEKYPWEELERKLRRGR